MGQKVQINGCSGNGLMKRTPEADFSAEVNEDKVWVAVLLGVIPAAASQS